VRAPLGLLLTAALLLTGCSGGAEHTPKVAEPPDRAALSIGANDLMLQPGMYLSPEGFVPPLELSVPAGWTSHRRGDDAFDVGRPLVVVAFITPKDSGSAGALTRLRRAAKGTVTNAQGTLAGQPAKGLDVVGGSGRLMTSPSGTIAVDQSPGRHLRVLGTDVDGVPLLAVVVLDGSRWRELSASATQFLAGVTPA
jgi:hypothetical protein